MRKWRWPGYLATMAEVLGGAALWSPFFWKLLSLEHAAASKDPTRISKAFALAFKANVGETAKLRDGFAATSDRAREEIRLFCAALRGRRAAGRVKRVDDQATEDAVYRLARKIEERRGEERGSTRRAKEILAGREGVKPAALTKRITRRLG